MANMYVKVYGFMIRGFVIETEAVDAPISNRKLVLFAKLVMEVVNVLARRTVYLIINEIVE